MELDEWVVWVEVVTVESVVEDGVASMVVEVGLTVEDVDGEMEVVLGVKVKAERNIRKLYVDRYSTFVTCLLNLVVSACIVKNNKR